jgi:hypothetical protein
VPSIQDPLDKVLYDITMEHLTNVGDYIPGPIKKAGGSRADLLAIYHNDPLFSIFGLDSPEYIAASVSGGTITSIHKKIGLIYEGCVKTIFMDRLGQSAEDITYRATIQVDNKQETRTADACLRFDRLAAKDRKRIEPYCQRELSLLSSSPQLNLIGVGMEVRHCYQTGDSKRTQADEAMARSMLVSGILPVMPLFCDQSNPPIMRRYGAIWVIKQGIESYSMVKEFARYDFYDLLKRNRDDFRKPIIELLRSLTQ